MKQTLTIMLALASMMSASAATNLLPSVERPTFLSTPSSVYINNGIPSADKVQTWLGNQQDGWYQVNGNNDSRYNNLVSLQNEGFQFGDNPLLQGVAVGGKFTIDNETLQDLSSLTFSMNWKTSGTSGTFAYSLWYEDLQGSFHNLLSGTTVYPSNTSWNIDRTLSEEQLTNLKDSASENFYLVLGVHGASNAPNTNIVSDMYLGETASVPEPATATLGLLGLGSLMLRRRRKD